MKYCPLIKKKCIGKKCINAIVDKTYWRDEVDCFAILAANNDEKMKQLTIDYKIPEITCKHFDVIIKEGKK